MGYLNQSELREIGFKSVGINVQISKKASIYNPAQISIGNNVRIDDFAVLSAGEQGIVIGNNVHIAGFCGLVGNAEIRMDDFSGLSSRVFIYSSSDDYSGASLTNPTVPGELRNVLSAKVHLGKHVIVGTCATILPGITIGKGSAIGAYCLVNKDIPEGVIATGQPCRVIKKRKADIFKLEEELRRKKKD